MSAITSDQAAASASFWKNNLRDYGLLVSLLLIMAFFEVATGGVVNVPAMTPLQTVNHGSEDLIVFAYGYPPDDCAEVLDSAV